MPVPPASAIVSTMSSTSRRTQGAVGSSTAPAIRRSIGWPMRAILSKAMVQNMWRLPAKVKHPPPAPSQRFVRMLNIAAGGPQPWPSGTCDRSWRRAPVQVLVRDNNVDQALRALKKKMQREGVFREMKLRRSYEKPSERANREKAEAVRRARKRARKQAIWEGLIAAPKKVLRPRGTARTAR